MCFTPRDLRRWQTYSRPALLIILELAARSQENAANGGVGWTEPSSQRALCEAVGVSRSEQAAIFQAVEREFDVGAQVGYGRSYRLKGLQSGSESDPVGETEVDRKAIQSGGSGSESDPLDDGASSEEVDGEAIQSDTDLPEVDRRAIQYEAGSGKSGSESDPVGGSGSESDPLGEETIPHKYIYIPLSTSPGNGSDQTLPESVDSTLTAGTETPEPTFWPSVAIAEIKRRYRAGETALPDLRVALAQERELPLRPDGVHTRKRADGTYWQRSALIEWLDDQLDEREKVRPEDLELGAIVAKYSFYWNGAQFDSHSDLGKRTMGIVKALVQEEPRPTPDLLKSAYAWWHSEKRDLDRPKGAGTVSDMYREYIAWKEGRGGMACSTHEERVERFTSGKYADIIES